MTTKETKRKEAEERTKKYRAMSDAHKLEMLNKRRGNSMKERKKICLRIGMAYSDSFHFWPVYAAIKSGL